MGFGKGNSFEKYGHFSVEQCYNWFKKHPRYPRTLPIFQTKYCLNKKSARIRVRTEVGLQPPFTSKCLENRNRKWPFKVHPPARFVSGFFSFRKSQRWWVCLSDLPLWPFDHPHMFGAYEIFEVVLHDGIAQHRVFLGGVGFVVADRFAKKNVPF